MFSKFCNFVKFLYNLYNWCWFVFSFVLYCFAMYQVMCKLVDEFDLRGDGFLGIDWEKARSVFVQYLGSEQITNLKEYLDSFAA